MYIHATDFLSLKSKIPVVVSGKKIERIVINQKRQTQIYTSIFKFC